MLPIKIGLCCHLFGRGLAVSALKCQLGLQHYQLSWPAKREKAYLVRHPVNAKRTGRDVHTFEQDRIKSIILIIASNFEYTHSDPIRQNS